MTCLKRPKSCHGLAACALLLLTTGCAGLRPSAAKHSLDSRIEYYEDRVQQCPKLYPAHAALAIAYLNKARETHDAVCVQRARAAAAQSLAIQPSLVGFQAMAAIANFAHQFEESIGWSNRAYETAPDDPSVASALVESLIALDRIEDAKQVCARASAAPDNFHTWIAKARIAVATGEIVAANHAYVRAADMAEQQGADEFAAWALIMASGVLIDTGQPKGARALLDRAEKLDAGSSMLALHRAELAEAEGRTADALRLYTKLADRTGDPAVHARAFAVARKLGNEKEARRHFDAAVQGYQKVLDAGEDYTRDALNQLRSQA